MYKTCRRSSTVISILILIIVVQFYLYHYTATVHGRFLALESNGGRLGNQGAAPACGECDKTSSETALRAIPRENDFTDPPSHFTSSSYSSMESSAKLFHICSGYGIAKELGRRQYIRTLKIDGFRIARHIQRAEEIFPRLKNAFITMEVGNEYRVAFAQKNGRMACCEYEDPSRLQNRTEQFLVLEMHYAQNVRYFEHMLPEIRNLLEFSDDVKREGKEVIQRWKMENKTVMCAHIRRSDFIRLSLATDLYDSVRKMRTVAKYHHLSEYLIFGDDIDFMRQMVEALHPSKARFSSNSEGVDFHIASRACGAFLVTAPTSTFGWWLAFFSSNQNTIYYNNNFASMDDKKPNKDLFLASWKSYAEKMS